MHRVVIVGCGFAGLLAVTERQEVRGHRQGRATDDGEPPTRNGMTLKRLPDGATGVEVVIVREDMNATGRLLGLVLGTVDKGVLGKAFRNSIEAIEARTYGAAAMLSVTVRAES
jgi:hypothetical protein